MDYSYDDTTGTRRQDSDRDGARRTTTGAETTVEREKGTKKRTTLLCTIQSLKPAHGPLDEREREREFELHRTRARSRARISPANSRFRGLGNGRLAGWLAKWLLSIRARIVVALCASKHCYAMSPSPADPTRPTDRRNRGQPSRPMMRRFESEANRILAGKYSSSGIFRRSFPLNDEKQQ